MFAAERAELLEFQPLRHGLFVLHAGVVLALAFSTLQRNLFARHLMIFPLRDARAAPASDLPPVGELPVHLS